MDINMCKEQFSIAYIQAVAAQQGFKFASENVDDDSIDISLSGKDFKGGKIRNPKIDIQLKCTTNKYLEKDKLKFHLKIKNYNDLRGTDVMVPRFLMVLVVPDNKDIWICSKDDNLKLFNSCYWYSLRNKPSTSNTTSVTIEIPTKNKVTPDSLYELLNSTSKRGY